MQTVTVYYRDAKVILNEKFVPGLVAGGIIYCNYEHEGYSVQDNHDDDGLEKLRIVQRAAKCNDVWK